MKKKVALMLIAVLIFILVFPLQAFAQYDKELEKAITTAKTMFNITDSYDEFNYYLNNYSGKTEFNLNWNDSKNKLGTISVTIDTKGKITNFYSYKPYSDRERRKLPAISKADGYKTAVQFLIKVNPSIWGNVKYNEETGPINFGETEYRYNFTRFENGIMFPANQVNVTVDNLTNEVRGYYLNWNDEASFPDTKGIITLDNAEKIYKEKLGLKLVYKMKYDEKSRKPYLVYTDVSGNQFIEAKTGEIVSGDNYYGYYGGDSEMARKEVSSNAGVSMSPQELEAVENAAGIMDEGAAEKTARDALKIDEGYQLGSINLYKDWQNPSDYVWNMYFNKEAKGEIITEYYNFSVSLDAKTGEITSFYTSIPYDKDAVVQYDEAQALDAAKNYIETMYPGKYANVEYTNWQQRPIMPLDETNKPRQYYFTFTRKSGGAYFMDNGFNITIDTVTGSVIGCNLNWYKGELPSTEKIFDLEQAYNILFNTIGLETRYVSIYSPAAYEKIMPRPESVPAKINLVYAVKQDKPLNIDASTGTLLDYAGNPYKKPVIAQYSDIKGNFAEKQINVLAEFGIALPGETFKPNQNITQKEFLSMLNKAVNPYFMYRMDESKVDDDLYNLLISSGIIKDGEKNPDAFVTRVDAVKFTIRALRFDKVADIKGIFSLPFKDAGQIKEELYGYVAIAYGLKIVQGNDGYFSPSANLTRAQAATVIYNYLNV